MTTLLKIPYVLIFLCFYIVSCSCYNDGSSWDSWLDEIITDNAKTIKGSGNKKSESAKKPAILRFILCMTD